MSVSRALAPSRNRAARSHSSPSSSFMRMSHSSAPLALRIPPAGLNPTAWPVSSRYSRIWRVITTPTGRVAFTASLPVDVLMKSAPAIIAARLARATFVRVARSPVPRITFRGAQPQHVGRGVVALEGREVDAGDGAEQPGGLPFLLDGAPGRDGGGAPLHGRAVHAHRADPVEVERDARVALGSCRHAERSLWGNGRR